MGESRRRQQAASEQLASVKEAADRAGLAIRKLATAASGSLGMDCVVHSELGRILLEDQGLVTARIVVGEAAWRTGPGDGDMVAHVRSVPGHLPPGAGPGSVGFAFHAWVQVGDILVDFTTYLLKLKASQLDAMDGQHTLVEWCPQILVAPVSEVSSFDRTLKAHSAGYFFYKHDPQVQATVLRGLTMDEADVHHARLIMRDPQMMVLGPNNLGLGPEH